MVRRGCFRRPNAYAKEVSGPSRTANVSPRRHCTHTGLATGRGAERVAPITSRRDPLKGGTLCEVPEEGISPRDRAGTRARRGRGARDGAPGVGHHLTTVTAAVSPCRGVRGTVGDDHRHRLPEPAVTTVTIGGAPAPFTVTGSDHAHGDRAVPVRRRARQRQGHERRRDIHRCAAQLRRHGRRALRRSRRSRRRAARWDRASTITGTNFCGATRSCSTRRPPRRHASNSDDADHRDRAGRRHDRSDPRDDADAVSRRAARQLHGRRCADDHVVHTDER